MHLDQLDRLSATLRTIALRAVAESASGGKWHRSCAHESARWCARHLFARADRLADQHASANVLDAVRDAASLVEQFAVSSRWTDADIHVARLLLAGSKL